jgi:hypothetical protein
VTRLLVAMLAPVLLVALAGCGGATPGAEGASSGEVAPGEGDANLATAFRDRLDDLQVRGRGTVVRVLDDDTDGDRHQRFILRLESGQTLLVAHNIDVAPRVDGLHVGDSVSFCGVYEWSAEGGTVHWTHHDPDGTHAPGWLFHGGETYQ